MGYPVSLPRLSRLALMAGLLVASWGVLVWLGGDWLASGRIDALIETQGALIDEHANALSYNLHRSLAFLHALPAHFVRDIDVANALQISNGETVQSPANVKASIFSSHPTLMALSRKLAQEGNQFGVDVTWVIDAKGDCIATSNFDLPESFLGSNYRDRDYFRMAMEGRLGHQFAVGRKTSVPGVYFSAPVMDGDRVLGAVVIKVDLVKLSPLLGSTDSFVTDEYGVVIMARSSELYMRALPQNRLDELTPEERELRYKKRDFQPLYITPWIGHHETRMFHFEGWEYPYLITTRAETDEGMTVHVINQLKAIEEIEQGVRHLKITVLIAGATLLLLAVGVILHLRSSAGHVRELTEKQAALETEKRRAEAATEAKARFLANMSHEIRTPMNGVLGLAHLMMGTELTPRQRDYLNKIEMSATALLSIINEILDLSKIDAGKLTIESVEFGLDTVLDHICNVEASRVAQKGIELLFHIDSGVPRLLVGDPLRLRQILLNLVGNAIKFTEKGEVLLSVGTADREAGRITLTFSIRDTGIGMTDEQQKNLFMDFTQADESTTRRFGGTGLGLSISKQLVEIMGGAINVTSQFGCGSTFFFTIPFGCSMTAEEGFVPPPQLRDLRTLVVDDNATTCEVEQSILTSWSMRVETAASGRTAIEKIERADLQGQPFELVIMAWQMPGLDGLQVAAMIKADEKLTLRPAMILATAYNREELEIRAKTVGISAVLTKPFAPSQLFDCVVSLFGRGSVSALQAAESTQTSLTASRKLRGAHVLVAEDNAINRQIAVELLGRVGVTVDVAGDGRQAADLVLAGGRSYDAVLMDVQMPVMDGLTATGVIRKLYDRGPLPIIAMTAHAMEQDQKRCIEAGMDDHVVKPVNPNSLYETLERWVGPRDPAMMDETPYLSDIEGAVDVDITSLFEGAKAIAIDPILPEHLAPFDLEKALERAGGDPEFLKMMIIDFHDCFLSAGTEMQSLIERQKLEEAYRLAHTVKGAVGSLEANSLFLAARDLEQALRPVDLRALSTAFAGALNETLAAAATLKDDATHGS